MAMRARFSLPLLSRPHCTTPITYSRFLIPRSRTLQTNSAGSRRPNPFSTAPLISHDSSSPLSSVPPATINGQPILSHMDHIVLTVADIDASVEFYVKVLGMRKEVFGPKGKERVALVFGSQKINLQHERAKIEPHAGEATKGSADICFITPHPMSSIISHLQALDVPHKWIHPHFRSLAMGANTGYFTSQKEHEETLLEPCIRTGAKGKIKSIYLRDPDGNLVEISHYEQGLV